LVVISPESIIACFQTFGDLAYEGEGVTQLEHARQCAHLARMAGATPSLQLACWLHDIGHLLARRHEASNTYSPTIHGHDDAHEHIGADALANVWGDAIVAPIRLHVSAKRYLVGRFPRYRTTLSADSVRSLGLQGGAMDAQECATFEQQPHHRQALQLRTWDDLAKVRGKHWPVGSSAIEELRAAMAAV
jgi:predicted HD phosphohydrolase